MPLAAKDVVEEKSPYAINKALFEEATSIKDQMNLVESRLKKMEEHRSQVSDAVYFKVKTDYETQLDGVRGSFQGKCRDIENELRQLYKAQREQESELAKHQEVLEEAKFRHTLGEFNEKKFKELEAKQNKEIQNYSEILDLIRGSIQQYENVLGHPFEDKAPAIEVAPTKPREEAKPDSAGKASAKKSLEESTQKNALRPAPTPVKEVTSPNFEEKLSEELDMFLGDDGDYFNPENEAPPSAAVLSEAASATTPSAPKPVEAKGLDDSISSILKNIPMDDGEDAVETRHASPVDSTNAQIDISGLSEASLLLIEGDLDDPEIVLGENTTIGRSPSNDIVLKESKISRQHATIHLRNGHYVLVDLKSSNGVFVNGQKTEEASLKDGDEVSIGSFKFQFNLV